MIIAMSAGAPVHTCPKGAAGALQGARALLGARIDLVSRLARKGLEIAAGYGREATGAREMLVSPVVLDWLAVAHAKVSRALRMAAFLRLRLLALLALVERGDARRARRALDTAGLGGLAWDDETTDAEPEAPEADPPDRLERLESLELFGPDPLRRYVMSRPVGELIAEICEGLGLGPEWLAKAERAWAAARGACVPAPSAQSAVAAAIPAPAAPSPSPPRLNRRARRRMRAISRKTSGLPPRPP